MTLDANAWLDACAESEVQQIVLLDRPAVLGWQRWREIGLRYGLGLVESLLAHAIEVGRIPQQPVSALAHVLMGALDEAALYVARAEDQAPRRPLDSLDPSTGSPPTCARRVVNTSPTPPIKFPSTAIPTLAARSDHVA